MKKSLFFIVVAFSFATGASAQYCGPYTAVTGTIDHDLNGDGMLNDTIHQEKRVGMQGHIAIQIHKGDQLKIRFNDIRIKELASNPSAWIEKSH